VKPKYFLILLGLAFSCSSNQEIKKDEQISNDTLINLSINGRDEEFKAKKGIKVNFKDIQIFLNDYSNKPLSFFDTTLVDVTGDGKNEKVIRTIKVKDNNAYIFAEIFKEEKLIYADTLKIDDGYTFMTWDNDSVYYNLKPYSSFYEALFNKEILDNLDKKYPGYEYWIEYYINSKKEEFATQRIDSLSIINKADSIHHSLQNFKGKLVFTMHQLDRDILIWNDEKNEFETFYSP
jgi:hypothetical protein